MAYDSEGYRLNEDGTRATQADVDNAPAIAGKIIVARDSRADEAADSTGASAFDEGGALYNSPNRRFFLRGQDGGNLAREALEFKQAHGAAQERLAQMGLEHKMTQDAFATQLKATQLENDQKQFTDAHDFLEHYSKLDHNSPTWERDVTVLMSKFPHGLPLVKDVVSQGHLVRKGVLESQLAGGQYEFSDPTAQTHFADTLNKTKDVNAARAVARNTQKGEEMLVKARDEGLLQPTDIPEWDGNGAKPDAYNTDGSLNYKHLNEIISTRRGVKTAGKPFETELQKTHGISPQQLLNPVAIYGGKLDAEGAFENFKEGEDKGNPDDVIKLDVGKLDKKGQPAPILMKRAEYNTLKEKAQAATGVAPVAPTVSTAAAPAGTPAPTRKPADYSKGF